MGLIGGRRLWRKLMPLVLWMVVAVVVAGLLFAFVLGMEPGRKADRARRDLRVIADAISLYAQRHGSFPLDGGLESLVQDQELKAVPLDPWGHPYLLGSTSNGVRIMSYGADGAPGGDGDDADLSVERIWANDKDSANAAP